MSGIGSSIAEAIRWIRNLGKRIEEPIRVKTMRELSLLVHEDIVANFATMTSPSGDPWAPLKYRVGHTLVLTGAMMRSAIAAVANPHISEGTYEAWMREPFYAPFMQEGVPRNNVPARPFFGLSSRAKEYIKDFIAEDKVKFIMTGPDYSIIIEDK